MNKVIYLGANGITNKNEISKFLWLIGEQGLQLYNTLFPNDKAFEDVLNYESPTPTLDTKFTSKTENDRSISAAAQQLQKQHILKKHKHCWHTEGFWWFRSAAPKFSNGVVYIPDNVPKVKAAILWIWNRITYTNSTYVDRMLRVTKLSWVMYDKKLQMKLLDGK